MQATRSNRVARVLAAIGVVVLCVAVVALAVPAAGPSVLDSRVAKVGLRCLDHAMCILDFLPAGSQLSRAHKAACANRMSSCLLLAMQDGDTVMVAYKGMLPNGEVFDQNDIDFTLGAGQMIEGWDKVRCPGQCVASVIPCMLCIHS